jgi:signal transduction histidine kinase
MSASAATAARGLPREPRTPDEVPAVLTAFATVAIAAAIGLIAAALWSDRGVVQSAGLGLVVWLSAIAVVGFASVSSNGGPQLGLDLPLLLAAGFLFGPGVGGALGFVGYADIREFRGEISVLRALYNRAQVSLSVMLAALVFSAAGGVVGEWPDSGLAALLALTADCALNYALVVTAKSLHDGVPAARVFRSLTMGSPVSFVLTYLAYGLLSLVLAQTYLGTGVWGLAASALPVVLARQAFDQSRQLELADDRLRAKSEALRVVSSRVADERRDERLVVAEGLHDEVLPPLVNIHLMGQVLRQDLARGRLLELEDDIPVLLRAVDSANTAVRGLISGLRRSPLGSHGFKGTLLLLVRHLQTLTPASFTTDVEDIGGPPLTQLLAYQVIQEALNNSVRHSGASAIRVEAGVHDGAVRLTVEDDGHGFIKSSVDSDSHFGLVMMRERVELIGGVLHIDSTPQGTRIVARLPLEIGGGENTS